MDGRLARGSRAFFVLVVVAAGLALPNATADAAGFNLGLTASYSNGRVSLSQGGSAGYVEIRR